VNSQLGIASSLEAGWVTSERALSGFSVSEGEFTRQLLCASAERFYPPVALAGRRVCVNQLPISLA
jgi:hypothetical protein